MAPTANRRVRGARTSCQCSGRIFSPTTKNGSSPKIRAASAMSPAHIPPARLSATATVTGAGIRSRTGVASRQKKSADRYHIGQCGSAHRSLKSTPPTRWRKAARAASKMKYGTATVRTSDHNLSGCQVKLRERYPVTSTNAGTCQAYRKS